MTSQDFIALIDSYGGYFSLREFHIQDGIDRMDTSFLRSYLAWRQWHGFSTLISSAWRKDDPNAHGKGMAIDNLLFTQWREIQATAMQHWLLATTWPFKGVGLYFDWNYWERSRNRDIPAIGLHIDGWDGNRPGQRPLRWLRIDGDYYYQSVTNGSFYCQANGRTTSLQKAINQFTSQ